MRALLKYLKSGVVGAIVLCLLLLPMSAVAAPRYTPLLTFTPADITFSYGESSSGYSVTLTNTGDGAAYNVALYADFGALAVTSPNDPYTPGANPFFTLPMIPAGGSHTLTFTLVNPDWCSGSMARKVVWQPHYHDATGIDFTAGAQVSAINPAAGAPDIQVNMSGAPEVIHIGETVPYHITSAYSGSVSCGSGSTGAVTVVDTVPAGFTVVNADGGIWVPGGDGTGGTITWSYTPPASLDKNIILQSPGAPQCEGYCKTTFTNSVSASVTACSGCTLNAAAAKSTAIACAEGVTSTKTASGPFERGSDTSYTNTYIFDSGSTVTLNSLVFTEHAENRQLYNPGSLAIIFDGVDITAAVLVTDTTTNAGGSLVLDFSGAPATALAGKSLVISYDLTATPNTVAACGNTTFYSWSSLNMGASGAACLVDGVIHETVPVTIGSPAMAATISGLPAVMDKGRTQTITLNLTQTSTFNPKDVKLELSGLNYYVVNPAAVTCGGAVAPVSCTPALNGSGNYEWTFNDGFTGQNQTATIQVTVLKRATGSGGLVATAYFDDRTTDNGVSDLLCAATATAQPDLLRGGDLIIENTPDVFVADAYTTSFQRKLYVINRGAGTAYNVWVDDLLGSDLQYVSAVVDNMTGVTVTGNQDHSGGAMNGSTIAIAAMTAGERRMITATGNITGCSNLTSTAIANWNVIGTAAQVSASDSGVVQIPTSPQLDTSKAITPLDALGVSTATATFRNSGDTKIYNVMMTATLPAGLTYIPSSTRWRVNGGGWNGPNAAYNPNPTTSPLVWTRNEIPGMSSMNPGDTLEINFELIADCSFTGGTVKVATQFEDPCGQIHTVAEWSAAIAPNAPVIGITGFTLSPATIYTHNDNTELTVTIANTGTVDAENLDLVVTLPDGLSYSSGSAKLFVGPDNTGTAIAIGDPTIVGNQLRFTNTASKLDNLVNSLQANGGNDTLVLKFSVRSSCYVTGNLGLTLYYYDACGATQYSTTASHAVTASSPNLSVVATPVVPYAECGSDVTWNVAVTNNGTGNAQVVRVEETLGAGLTYVPGSFTAIDKPGTVIADLAGNLLGWEFNNLAAGATARFTLKSTVDSAGCAIGSRQSSVRAIWGGGTTGEAVDNNPATTSYDCTIGTWANAAPATVAVIVPTVTAIVIDQNQPQTLYSGVEGKGVYKSSDGGQIWVPTTGQPGNLRIKQLVIHPSVAGTLFAASYGSGIFTSSDSGNSWSACSGQPANLNSVALTIAASGRLYAGTEGGIFSSSDCNSWSDVNSGLTVDTAKPPVVIVIAGNTLYAGLDGLGIWKKVDTGDWTAATGLPANSRVKAIVMKDSANLYAALYGSGVYKSTDSGGSWSACGATGLTNTNLLSLKINGSGYLYAGTESGIFVSVNDCGTWNPMNSGLP